MKIGVCISGATKLIENSLETINKLKEKYDVKLFIHTWDFQDEKLLKENSFSGGHNKYDVNNIKLKFSPDRIKIEKFEDKYKYFQNLLSTTPFVAYHRRDVGIYSMYYSLYMSNLLKIEYEKENNKLDCVIRIRFDTKIHDNFYLESYNLDKLNIPIGEDWGGINDRFAFARSEIMDLYSMIYPNLESGKFNIFHPETIMMHNIQGYSIPVDRINLKTSINNVY